MNKELLKAHGAQIITGKAAKPVDQLTKQEQATHQNLKTGLAIFCALAIVGAVFDVIA